MLGRVYIQYTLFVKGLTVYPGRSLKVIAKGMAIPSKHMHRPDLREQTQSEIRMPSNAPQGRTVDGKHITYIILMYMYTVYT